MKRTAAILGIAAALGVAPPVAAAASNPAQQKPQQKVQVVAQVLKPQPLSPALLRVATVSSHRTSAYKITLLIRAR